MITHKIILIISLALALLAPLNSCKREECRWVEVKQYVLENGTAVPATAAAPLIHRVCR